MRIYISGAISGTNDYMERFANAEKHLKDNGHFVVNPALVNSNLPPETEYEDYMKMAFCMLGMCDTIYMLKGWEESPGANREYGYALWKQYGILMEAEHE